MSIDPLKYADLIPKVRAGDSLKCPYCGSDKFQYGIEEYENRPGYGYVYFLCPDCERTIHFSGIDI